MKKFIKVTAIIGCACLVAGCAMAFSAAAMGADMSGTVSRNHMFYDFDTWDEDDDNYISMDHLPSGAVSGEKLDDRTYSFTNVRKLDLDIGGGSIEVVTGGEGDKITVNSDTIRGFLCYVEDETLKVKGHWGRRPRDIDGTITVTVPVGYAFKEAVIDVKAGVAQMKELTAEELEIDVKSGSIDIENATVSSDLKADCMVGQINLGMTGKKSDFNYELGSSVGDIELGDSHYSGLVFDKTISNGAAAAMELDCKVGSIVVTFQED